MKEQICSQPVRSWALLDENSEATENDAETEMNRSRCDYICLLVNSKHKLMPEQFRRSRRESQRTNDGVSRPAKRARDRSSSSTAVPPPLVLMAVAARCPLRGQRVVLCQLRLYPGLTSGQL